MSGLKKFLDRVFLMLLVRNRNSLYELFEQFLLREHKVYSNREKLSISPKAHVSNALFNCASGNVIIEDYVFFGQNVYVIAATHDYTKVKAERVTAIPERGYDIIIRNGAWVGSNVVIIGPCEIGQNSVVAAGSVVKGNVEQNVIVAGNPAKKIRDIYFND